MRKDVIYLIFNTREEAINILTENNAVFSEFQDHFESDIGWGTVFNVPNRSETFVNLYDGDSTPVSEYEIPAPSTPYNVRA